MMLTPAEKAWEELLRELSRPVPRSSFDIGLINAYLTVLSVVPTKSGSDMRKMWESAYKAVARIER